MTSTRVDRILSGWRITLFVCVIAAAGCAPAPGAKPGTGVPELAPLPPLPAPGSVHYRVDPVRSDVRILVYRGGPLAKVGHNHVVRVHDLRGDIYLAEPMQLSGFRLSFPVAAMEVDPPAARAEAGGDFATALSPEAVAATYTNMIGAAVLDAARFPDVTLRSVAVRDTGRSLDLAVRITLHGVSRDQAIPVQMEEVADGVVITGEFTLLTSDFSMTPFSVLGGGLQVLDEVKIQFRIESIQAHGRH